ncbi:bifunctional biotin--[acetyl-CoA-carboxylase] ligase/biotin operon repressor BirA [Pokkaliibacter sp. MBI-7]|uniref:bifunctional biotin--[acetyl-CoA-carboxylase] ligase/biotin operon repressor BirA n=1 Tax=Pokkaliibacter sp. MBI-7 TaxID=3040600 RepID=UPI002446E200|nr:bifunctional biotin--[acetyl-CoA-carboxylase] ligase/biotin operon repressor BirA [Pokkaliibacter sp. MBI-7]MDH2433865.1 bifunctional biotin--[acetyl-CoA-carboxylase] ligase/biotin operon repressor BirA [Pokkaliibacter sp. MBI-7]
MDLKQVLDTLADGQWHSGAELGEALGVSRAAVWKQLQKLEALGLVLHAVKGRGYRLVRPLELIDVLWLDSTLKSNAVTRELLTLHYFLSLDSSNKTALELTRCESGHGHLIIAEHQAAGRGRRGRAWVSPFGENIYFSLIWSFQSGLAALEGLSLAVGLALARTLSKAGVSGVGLKWPNDVLIENKKVAGILLELSGEAGGVCQVVIGVGVNVEMQDQMEQITQPWCSLRSYLPEGYGRNRLLADLLQELVAVLQVFQREGFVAVKQEWMSFSVHQGLAVRLQAGEQCTEGVMVGLTDTGGLRVATEQGEEVFHGGEVSVRALSTS